MLKILFLFPIFAGAVVANRLSEIKHWRILLLEAGPDENEISDVSLRSKINSTKTSLNIFVSFFSTKGSLTCSIFAVEQIGLGLQNGAKH